MTEKEILKEVEEQYAQLNEIEKEKLVKQALKTRILTKLRTRKSRKNKKLRK